MSEGMKIYVERKDILQIVSALAFAADHAENHSTAYDLLKLRDRIETEWNNEMRRRAGR